MEVLENGVVEYHLISLINWYMNNASKLVENILESATLKIKTFYLLTEIVSDYDVMGEAIWLIMSKSALNGLTMHS